MSEVNKSIFNRVTDNIWNAKNPNMISEIYAADYVMHTPGGDFEGHAGYREIYDTYANAFPNCHFTVNDIIAEGDRVVIRYTFEGTHGGDLLGIPSTGKDVSIEGIAIARIEDGKIAEEWAVWDLHSLLQQVG